MERLVFTASMSDLMSRSDSCCVDRYSVLSKMFLSAMSKTLFSCVMVRSEWCRYCRISIQFV